MSNIEIMFIVNSVLFFSGFGIWQTTSALNITIKVTLITFALVNLLFGIGKLF